MKKRLLAGLLTVVMLFSMLPVSALAAGDEIPASGGELLSGTYTVSGTVNLTGQIVITGDVTISGTGTIKRTDDLTTYMIVVQEGASLTLDGVTIDGGAVWSGDIDTTLNRGTTNTGISAKAAMIYNFGTLTIQNGTVLQNNSNESTRANESGIPIFATTVVAESQYGWKIYTYPTADEETSYGGAVVNGGTMTITGGEIKNNQAFRGAGVCSYGVLKMTGGTVSNNHTVAIGDVKYADGAGIYLSGGKNSGTESSPLDWTDDSVKNSYCEISGGSITNNTSDGNAGGIIADSYSKLYLSGSYSITNNECGQEYQGAAGGGVSVYTAYCEITGGTISGNRSLVSNSGGVNANASSIFKMSGGTITENEAAANGGGIAISSKTTATISGGTISKNSAVRGGGIAVTADASNTNQLTLSDSVVIEENTATFGGAGIYINQAGANVVMEAGTVQKNTVTAEVDDSSSNFYYYGSVYITNGGSFTMQGGTISENTVTLTNNSTKSLYGRGAGLVVDNGTATISGGTIGGDSAGNTVTVTGISAGGNYAYGAGIYVGSNGSLVFSGGTVSYNTTTAAQTETGSGVLYAQGGGVYIDAKYGTSSLTGGTISNNAVKVSSTATSTDHYIYAYGGGVYITNLARDLVIKSRVSSNTVEADSTNENTYAQGGGLYVKGSEKGKVELVGDVTSNTVTATSAYVKTSSTAYAYGAGVYLNGVSATVTSSIAGNKLTATNTADNTKASAYGGGIYSTSASVVLNSGASISDNTVISSGGAYGGGIEATSSTVEMNKGSEISGNIAKTTDTVKQSQVGGGGVDLGASTTFTMNGGTISENVADGFYNGGGAARIANATATFTLNDGTISSNIAYNRTTPSASKGGGAFFVANDGTLNIAGGEITGNAGYNGGAITFIDGTYFRGTVNITGGTITGNYSTSGNGGAINLPAAAGGYDQTVNISGNPDISGNFKGATINTIDASSATTENNIYLPTDEVLYVVGELTPGANIDVTMQNPSDGATVASGSGYATSEDAAYFYYDGGTWLISESDGNIILASLLGTYYDVKLDLTNVTASRNNITEVSTGDKYSVTLTPASGYTLPSYVTVTGEKTNDYSVGVGNYGILYDSDGTVTIDSVSKAFTIAASGVARELTTSAVDSVAATYGEAINAVDLTQYVCYDDDTTSIPTADVASCEVTGGALPDGMSVSKAGVLSGTPTEAGTFTANVTVTAKNGKTATLTVKITVNTVSLSSAEITFVEGDSYPYTGSEIEPEVTVELDGVTLTEDVDYEVIYKSNSAVGTATVTISGIGGYKGATSETFAIINNVTFTSGKQNKTSTAAYAVDSRIDDPSEDFAEDGYTLVWYTTEDFQTGTEWDFDSNVVPATAEVSLYAQYTQDKVTVTYTVYYNGGEKDGDEFLSAQTINNVPITKKLSGYTVKNIPEGYTLSNWYVDDVEVVDITTYELKGDTSFVAYLTQYCEVTLVYNDDSGAASAAFTKVVGETFNVTDPGLMKDGYSYVGWISEDGTLYEDGAEYTVTGNDTLTVAWAPKTHTVQYCFVIDGKVADEYTHEVLDVAHEKQLNGYNSVPSGYTLVGWYSDESCTVSVDPKGYELNDLTDVVTFYGKLEPIGYTVTFDAGEHGSYSAAVSVNEDYDTEIDLSQIEPPTAATGYEFTGWAEGNTPLADTYTVTGNANLTAQYAEKTYTVNYYVIVDDADPELLYSTEDDNLTVKYTKTNLGGYTGLATYLTSLGDGYSLEGWYYDQDCLGQCIGTDTNAVKGKNLADYVVDNEQTEVNFYAKVVADTHTITYDTDGGSAVVSGTATTNGTFTAASAPTKTNYVFVYWTDESVEGSVYEAEKEYDYTWTTDVELTAVYAPQYHSVTYVYVYPDETAEQAYKATKVRHGSTLSGYNTVPTGYTLEGWYTDSACEYDSYYGSTVKGYVLDGLEQDVVFYGKLIANSYTVTYYDSTEKDYVDKTFDYDKTYYINPNGGEYEGNDSRYQVLDKENATLVTPTRTGYKFMGWKWVENTQTFKAQWKAANCTVTFNGNENTGGYVPGNQTVAYGSILEEPDEIPTKTGYTLVGWSTNKDADPEDETELWIFQTSTDDGTPITGDITLYAVWKQTGYLVTYTTTDEIKTVTLPYGTTVSVNPDGGEFNDNDKTISWSLNGPLTLDLNSATRTGYDLIGWKYNSEANRFTAVWSAEEYTVTFDANGGTLYGDSSVTVAYGKTVDQPDVTRTGYTFNGWVYYDEETESNVQWNFSKDAVTGNITLTASWTLEGYIVTYDAYVAGSQYESMPERELGVAGNDPITIDPNTGTYNDDTYKNKVESFTHIMTSNYTLAQPTKEGYNFIGWSLNDGTFTAEWEKSGYTVTYYTDTNNDGTLVQKVETINANSLVRIDLDGGEAGSGDTGVGGYGSDSDFKIYENIVLSNPTKSGYAFTGWKHTTENGTEIFTAQWEIAKYTVTFDYNGGYSDDYNETEETAVSNKIVNLPATGTYKTSGYELIGWTTKTTGEVEYLLDETKVITNVTGDMTLYAVWAKVVDFETIAYGTGAEHEAKLTFDPSAESADANDFYTRIEDGTLSIFPRSSLAVGEHTEIFPVELTDGSYSYVKAYVTVGDYDYTVTAGLVINGDVVNGNLASVYGNSGEAIDFASLLTEAVSYVKTEYGGAIEIPESEIAFTWTNGSEVKVTTYGDTYYNLVEWADGNIYIYVDLTVGNYVQFYSTSEKAEEQLIDTVFVEYGDTVDQPEEDPTLLAYTFLGWYLDGTQYDFETPVTSYLAIYAEWSYTLFDITFDLNYDTTDTVFATQTAGYGGKVADPGTPTREGYTLTGWFTEPECKNQWQADATVTGDLTLYAGWKINTYTVTFNTNYGVDYSEAPFAPQTVEYGGYVTYPGEPTREGYVFTGWYSDYTCEHWYDCETNQVTEDITLYAGWAEIQNGVAVFTVKTRTSATVEILITDESGDADTTPISGLQLAIYAYDKASDTIGALIYSVNETEMEYLGTNAAGYTRYTFTYSSIPTEYTDVYFKLIAEGYTFE